MSVIEDCATVKKALEDAIGGGCSDSYEEFTENQGDAIKRIIEYIEQKLEDEGCL